MNYAEKKEEMMRVNRKKFHRVGFIGMMLLAGAAVSAAAVTESHGAEPLNIGDRRELFLDDLLVERLEGDIARRFHEPVAREIVMEFDQPWEGNCVGYGTVLQEDGLYRMWYRPDGPFDEHRTHSGVCYAESEDGIHWTRPVLGLVEFRGSKDHNIVWRGAGRTTFHLFKDENPDAAPEARFKGTGLRANPEGFSHRVAQSLMGMVSPDGLSWALLQEQPLITDGHFDSQNVVFWDPNINAYRAYYRYVVPGSDFYDADMRSFFEGRTRNFFSGFRHVKTATSPDFVNWTPGELITLNQTPSAQFYTNQIQPYHRAPHIYLGLPGMYDDRGWTPALEQLPDRELREAYGRGNRIGTALTETLLIWSRDGKAFDRSPNTFMRPGPEGRGVWWYSYPYVKWGWVETASHLEGAAPELSFYAVENYFMNRFKGEGVAKMRRYTLRLDGFASLRASIDGGELITPPVIFEGSALSMNFATSGSGSVRVELQDAEGTPIPGFTLDDSIELYGDTVARNAMWLDDPDLSALAGRPVRLRFVMRDADLYSIKFE